MIDLSKLTNVKRQADGSIQCQCPACASDGEDLGGKNHLRIYTSGAFSCVKHGDDRAHNRTIRAFLRGTSPTDEGEVVYIDPAPKLSVDITYPEATLSRLLRDFTYWRGRGIDERTMHLFEGGVAAESERSKLSGRWVFPARNALGQIVGFSGRLLQSNSYAPKWKILGRKGQFIFPRAPLGDSVILVEGIGDALALAQCGVTNVMCLFGLTISGEQIGHLISQGVTQIVIATNNETSGIGNRAAEALKGRLRHFFDEANITIHLPPRKDLLDSLPDHPEEIEAWGAALAGAAMSNEALAATLS